jgi:hypothetical protein
MMSMEEASTSPTPKETDVADVTERARRELERARDADDATRLAALEKLHEVLEEEVDKASPPGH